MSNTTKTKGGVRQRRENALARLQVQLEKDTKVATVYDAEGKKRKALVPLEGKDKLRITGEMQRIKSKLVA